MKVNFDNNLILIPKGYAQLNPGVNIKNGDYFIKHNTKNGNWLKSTNLTGKVNPYLIYIRPIG
jgi:hypothetical protein